MHAFAAVADETRRSIVLLVAKEGELPATEICRNFQMSPAAVSQHLKILREAAVLQVKKDAQRRIYSLNPSGIQEMETWLLEIRDLWNKRLDRLGTYLVKLKKERTNERRR
ncbi:MAG TPA: metalloregulator ArsR/SmtB family transcription factor [Spirochaetia bacterium]|nr:metalloregulator ArsR/SmtB family transcription factor [Spirochaetia bacterium]